MRLLSSVLLEVVSKARLAVKPKAKAILLFFQTNNSRSLISGIALAALLALPLSALTPMGSSSLNNETSNTIGTTVPLAETEQPAAKPASQENTGSQEQTEENQSDAGTSSNTRVRAKISVKSSTSSGGDTTTSEQTVVQQSDGSGNSSSINFNSTGSSDCEVDDDGDGDVKVDCETDFDQKIDCKNGVCEED